MDQKPTEKPTKGKKPGKPRKAAAKKVCQPDAAVTAERTPEQAPEPAPRKMGRPTKYDPAMCEKVIELGEQGKSRVQIACALGISIQTFHNWQEAHPEFLEAVKVSQQYCQAWWEEQGQCGLGMGKDFNATAFIFQMKNRFKADYSDKIEVKHDATAAFTKIWQMVGTGKVEGATP